MLKSIDQALAGAIDVIADDVQATVKSVREQGMMRTLGDAVEDAAGMVVGGAGSALSGMLSGKKGEKTVSSHSGVSSGYADIMAGGKAGSFGGGAAFPYVPNSGPAKAKAPLGNFGPGIGIRLPNAAPPAAPPIMPYTGAAGAGAGQFRPPPPAPMPAPGPLGPGALQAPAGLSPYASSAPSSGSPGKEPTIPTETARFEAIVAKDPAANSRCFECGSHDHEWASVSFGILLCITCAGHHRQLGTHISRIRSCKMDSWTERQLSVFNAGGNKRLAEFFKANNVAASQGFQRYSTAAADWYREAWIKNRTLGRPVPAPVQGVVVGPCIDESKPQANAKAAAPPVDLLDMGDSKPTPAKPAEQADLLNFEGSKAPEKRQEADLLGSNAGGDLLGLAAAKPPANDLLSLGADFGGQAAQAPTQAGLQRATGPAALGSSDQRLDLQNACLQALGQGHTL